MEIKKSLFSGGEIDPALHDNIDINAWRLGLAKGLNIHAGKNGRLVNDAGTYFLKSYDSSNVRVCPVEGEDYAFIFYHDGTNGRVEAVLLDSYMYYSFLSSDKVYVTSAINTGYTASVIPELQFKTVKHNDGKRWLYAVNPDLSIKRYNLSGGVISSEDITFEVDIPDVEGVTETVANFSNLAGLTPLSLYENNSVYVLSDATTSLRGWYKYISGVWTQQTVNTIADLTAGGYNASAAAWTAFTGATVQYGITLITDKGEESQILAVNTYRPAPLGTVSTDTAEYSYFTKLPSTADAIESIGYVFNNIYFLNADYSTKVTHARVYRRPITPDGTSYGANVVAGAWGYVGDGTLSSQTPNSNTTFKVSFTEFNVQADYLNQPPYVSQDLLDFMISIIPALSHPMKAYGIAKYDSRLVYFLDDKVLFSKVGAPNNFLRNFPTDANNSFLIEVGTGDTKVYGIEDSNGLIIFTDKGVKVGTSKTVSQADPRLTSAGDWIIDQRVGSLTTSYGVLFIDSSTNSIRRLGYSQELQEFIGQDIGSLASHLFYNRKVVSWALKPGDDSTIVVIFDDGSALNITYDIRSKVFGFFPKETDGLYKSVVPFKHTSDNLTCLIYIVERDGVNYVEVEAQRRASNSEAIYIPQIVNFAHSTKVHSNAGPFFTGELKRNNVEDWETELVIEAVDSGTELNSYFKCFNFVTGESCLMKYTSQNGDGYPIFTIVENALPESMQGKEVALFKCTLTVTGLEHLEGKDVSVMADSSLISSPYNADYPTLTVIDGQITLPNYAAFVLVGLPYISDIVTLQIDTDANNTTLLKPKIVNSVHVKFDQTRGVYVGGELPSDNSVTDMQAAEVWNIESSINTTPLPQTARKQYRLMSNWRANGSIALRQVDPLPFEVMSVILDVSGG